MYVLVTCNNQDDLIKNEGDRVFTTLLYQFFRGSRAGNSRVVDGIQPKFKLTPAFMHVFVTCKNEDDSIKNEGARVVTTIFPL